MRLLPGIHLQAAGSGQSLFHWTLQQFGEVGTEWDPQSHLCIRTVTCTCRVLISDLCHCLRSPVQVLVWHTATSKLGTNVTAQREGAELCCQAMGTHGCCLSKHSEYAHTHWGHTKEPAEPCPPDNMCSGTHRW